MSKENENKYQIYIKSEKRWEPVTEEFHKNYFREIDTFRHKQQRNGCCTCTRSKWWLCDMNCEECEFRRAGNLLSLEAEMATDEGSTTLADTIPDEAADIEEAIMLIDTIDALNEELNRLDPESRRICELIMDGKSERESAQILGIPRSTYKRHWSKLKADLYDKLKDYI